MERTFDGLVALLAAGAQESLRLEFKATESIGTSEGKKRELAKDVSAFANADGGDLIFGVREPQPGVFELDGGVDSTEFGTEWMDNVLGSIIRPRIPGLQIHSLPSPDDATRVYYVVSVPRSSESPHMAKDDKFYRRRNVQSSPMEEYEVRDLYRRVAGPILRLSFQATRHDVDRPGSFRLIPQLTNLAVTPSTVELVRIFVSPEFRPFGPNNGWSQERVDLGELDSFRRLEALVGPFRQFGQVFGGINHLPSFLGAVSTLPSINLVVDPAFERPSPVLVALAAPLMSVQVGSGLMSRSEAGWTTDIDRWAS